MHPIQVLERYWNYTSFRPLQEDIINAVLDNNDTFALLPTGGGKSICFQIPALIKPGLCIVISPLVALMQDQVNTLKQKGIKAIAITSGLSYNDLDTQLDNCIYGNYKFLYLSPERLQQPIVQERIQQMDVNLIAVDEAHCISQWGNDFRPAYREINVLRQLKPSVNCIALTATAKENVIVDTISALDFFDLKLFKASFYRENISYQVTHTEDKNFQLKLLLNENKGASIIYVRSRKATLELSNYLKRNGFEATNYHGGLSTSEKKERLNDWTTNKTPIMVATTAFGMGIDKADVRSVIHYNLPESLESYYQEAGRAGRDGKKSIAVILKKNIDEDKLKSQFLSVLPTVDVLKHVYKKLCNYFQISYGEGEYTSHLLNFKDFCKTYNLKTALTYNALKALDTNSIISLEQQFNYRTTIQFKISNHELTNYLIANKNQNVVIKSILRTYGGVFDFITKINLDIIASKSEQDVNTVIAILKDLQNQNIIELKIANTDSEITFIKPREDEKTINPIVKNIQQQQKLKQEQIDAVIAYTNNTETCKSIQLLDYFGEKTPDNCNICSVCLSKQPEPKSTKEDIKIAVLELLKQKDVSSRDLLAKLNCNQNLLLEVIGTLVEDEKIKITSTNTYRIND
ncbi:MAG: RecQ family ATP-dependent DNA helicase [Winogradskyella sp.]|uniref:RecQ family ATP-dependent DNA helicase n=1 Tax=Winogradskyella sp. TaxID=1883156 RepID=UPI000F3C23FF|nr:ATP-dependent DNA helicase RecQ [Winogradskyella sp.]RNC86498.1 MAG: RecQ family ATP-dependent DNA helicase [Winogradskyella sp.]